jgi:hypothetical protein
VEGQAEDRREEAQMNADIIAWFASLVLIGVFGAAIYEGRRK